MRIMIIDDDEYKSKNLIQYFKEDETICLKSYCSGMIELITNGKSYDLLFLDMNFPFHDDEMIEERMGLSVLSELRRKKINIPTVIYSSDKIDVSDYKNIIDYIVYNPSVYIKNEVNNIKTKVLSK